MHPKRNPAAVGGHRASKLFAAAGEPLEVIPLVADFQSKLAAHRFGHAPATAHADVDDASLGLRP